MNDDDKARERPVEITDEMVADARKAVHKAIAPNWMSIYGALGEQAEYEAFLDTVAHAALEAALNGGSP